MNHAAHGGRVGYFDRVMQTAKPEALDRLAEDATLRARLGSAARERVVRYAVEGMVAGTEAVYRELTK